jgi:hypothetical protein
MTIHVLPKEELPPKYILYGYRYHPYDGPSHDLWICRECAEDPDNWPDVTEVAEGEEWTHDDFCPICGSQLVLCKYTARGEECPDGCWSDETAIIGGKQVDFVYNDGRLWRL